MPQFWRYDGTYRLSLFMQLSQSVDVNYVMPCMLPGHVSQGPFHSFGVRRHFVHHHFEMMYFTITTESPGHDHFKQLPTPRPEGLELFLWLPEG